MRSLNANFVKLEVFIQRLLLKPSIIVCTETWQLQNHEFFNLPGYKIYYNYSKINKADGVVMYIKDNIEETTEIVTVDNISILRTDVKVNVNGNLRVSALYRSHDLVKTEFVLSLKKYLNSNVNMKNHCIVGDFNIDILNNENIMNQEFLNNLLEKEYIPCFTGITRPSNENNEEGTCIDNIFMKSKNIVAKSYKITNPFNDHFPLIIKLDKLKINQQNESTTTRVDYIKLTNITKKVDWNMIYAIDEPNEAVNNLIKIINTCIYEATIINKRSKKNKNTVPRKKWITSGIIVSCTKKEMLYNLWKKEPKSEQLKNEYMNYNKILSKVIIDAKHKYERNNIEKISDDPKKIWQIVNSKLGKTKKKVNNINSIVENNVKIENKNEIANAMNNYFCKVGSNLSNQIKKPLNANLTLPEWNPKTIFIQPTNSIEIENIIKELKEKSGGVDNIHSKTLKMISHIIATPLQYIFNLCIQKSVWPDALKAAEIVPIFKAGNKSIISNYRPISLISNLAKIFEKIIFKRLYNFLQECNIISDKQYGFVKNKGTKNALNEITNIIYKKLDKSKPMIAVFLDLAKAFDTVNHQILLDKLERYGVRGNTLDLFASYLSNRQQKVRLEEYTSEFKKIDTGVPQGTILGPLLFILYMNDLLKDMPNNNILSYADDTVIISDDDTWAAATDKINILLNKVAIWLALNKLTLNTNKTVYIAFGNYCDSVPSTLNIEILGHKINRVDSYKYLGVIFDYNMKWDKHIDYLIKRTKYQIFVFAKLKKIMNTKTLMTIYYAIFHSIVNYGIIAWGGAYQNNLMLIQRIQTRILKIINKNKFPSCNPLDLNQCFKLESVLFHYPELKEKYLNSTSRTRNKSLQLPKISKTISNKNSYIVAIKIFNSLPNDLKDLKLSKASIKKKLKKFINEY